MGKMIITILSIIYIFSGCISKEYIHIKNSTNRTLYYNNGLIEGDKSPIVFPDTTAILSIYLKQNGKVAKTIQPNGLVLALGKDTLVFSEQKYEAMLDSISQNRSSTDGILVITTEWFYKQKEKLNE